MSRVAIRWSDQDRYLGPFTYARDRKWRPITMMLGSGDGDEHPYCRLRLSAFGHTLITRLPGLIQPHRVKVCPNWDAETVKRLGRDWYYDATEREYGFTYSEGHLSFHFGRQTHDSGTEQQWGCFLPWTQWRFVRRSFYDLNGAHFWTDPGRPKTKLKREAFATMMGPRWEMAHKMADACPARTFSFYDFDGEDLTAATRIEEREWRFGEGLFKWLSWFAKPKVRRSLKIDFSNETGRRKGSYKGGTMGSGIDMLPDELHAAAFARYCAEHQMTMVTAEKEPA